MDNAKYDNEVAEIIEPIVRKIYGDLAEVGHYKLAIAAWKLGREQITLAEIEQAATEWKRENWSDGFGAEAINDLVARLRAIVSR